MFRVLLAAALLLLMGGSWHALRSDRQAEVSPDTERVAEQRSGSRRLRIALGELPSRVARGEAPWR